jgi:hypothetical protein
MACAHANGFLVIDESLHVGVLWTSAAKGNIFLAWRGESWLDDCLEFGPQFGSVAQIEGLCDKNTGAMLAEDLSEWGRGYVGMLDFNYTLFRLQLRKSTDTSVSSASICCALPSIVLTAFLHATFLVCYFH